MIRYTGGEYLTKHPTLCLHIVSDGEKYLCTKEEKQWFMLGCSVKTVRDLAYDFWRKDYASIGYTIRGLQKGKIEDATKPQFWNIFPDIDAEWRGYASNNNFYVAQAFRWVCRDYVLRHPEREFPNITSNDNCDFVVTYEDGSFVIPNFHHSASEDEDVWLFMGMLNMLGEICADRDGVRLTNRELLERTAGYEGEE